MIHDSRFTTRDEVVTVSAVVGTRDKVLAARAVEALTRAATGLALEGLFATVSIYGEEADGGDDA